MSAEVKEITWYDAALRLVFGTALVLSILMQLGLLFRPADRFLERPQIEDAYYAFSVSRSIANGRGFAIDGLHPTNGVQPLVCILYAPAFVLFDESPVAPLRLVLLLNIIIGLAGGVLFGRLVGRMIIEEGRLRKRTVQLVATAAYLVNYSLSTHLLNGLETGLTLSILLVIFLRWNQMRRGNEGGSDRSLVEYGLIGLLLGLAAVSRIDTLLLGIAFVVDLFFFGSHGSTLLSRFRSIIAPSIIIAAGALLVSLPWWIYNLDRFGHFLPVSGQSQADLAPDRFTLFRATFNTVSDALIPGLHTPQGWGVYGLTFFGLLAPAILLLMPMSRRWVAELVREMRRSLLLADLRVPLLYGLIMILAYTFFFGAPHFQPRYLVLLQVLALALIVLAMCRAIERVDTWTSIKRGFLLLGLVLYTGLNLLLLTRHYNGSYNNPLLETVVWIEQYSDRSDKIGIFQSGTSEYFFPGRVTNLDGKVNPEAHAAYRQGRLGSYVDSMEFDLLIDWPLYTDRVFRESPAEATYRPIDTLANHMIVWKKEKRADGNR